MYEESRCVVKVQSKTSEPFKYERGVRQGCPTSPDLFNVYINVMLNQQSWLKVPGLSEKVKGLHFADDTVVFGESKEELEQNLKKILDWCKINCMEINVSKCGFMKFSNQQTGNDGIEILYNGEVVPRAKNYEYLGINLNDKLSYKEMAQHRITKRKRTLGVCKRTLQDDKISLKYKSMILEKCVSSHINI